MDISIMTPQQIHRFLNNSLSDNHTRSFLLPIEKWLMIDFILKINVKYWIWSFRKCINVLCHQGHHFDTKSCEQVAFERSLFTYIYFIAKHPLTLLVFLSKASRAPQVFLLIFFPYISTTYFIHINT